MVKMMLGITTFILINSLAHSTSYHSKEQHNSYPRHKKKNSMTPTSHTKEPDVETINDTHMGEVKKNFKFVGDND